MAIQILMPALSPTMTEGTLAKWLKKEGDAVASGEVLAEIETDKATMEFEAADDGVLGKIIVPEGSEGVAVNQPIAVLLQEGEDLSAADALAGKGAPAAAAKKPEAAKPAAAPQPQPQPAQPQKQQPTAPPQAAPPQNGGRVFASPLARRLAKESNIDLAALRGSGPHGRIVKSDIEQAKTGGVPARAPVPAAAPASAPAAKAPPRPAAPLPGAEGTYTDVALTNIRRVIAQRLQESKRDIPHFYLTVDCEIDKLLKLREELNGRAPKEGAEAYKLSVNDFVIRAVALAMRKVPDVNVSWAESAVRHWHAIDVSVAVATPAGLITPIIRNADQKGLAEISNEMKDLATRAKDNKLQLHEFQGGCFTISNLGMYGIKEFSAIINPPQSCILAVGAGEKRPVVKDGALAIATMMSCTMSTDHRTVDGALGAQFIVAFKALIEDPLTMLL
jgi:pyruvate dehydrogenase E2 component (dihydrolipoamide acetyltransferase)